MPNDMDGKRAALIMLGFVVVVALLSFYYLPTKGSAASGLSASEEAAIKQELVSILSRLEDHDILGQNRTPCTSVFTLGEPKILDAALSASTGKVQVVVPVTATNPIYKNGWRDPYYYPTDRCYGAPPSGWSKGMTAGSRYEVNVEKWSSGWRMSQQQDQIPR